MTENAIHSKSTVIAALAKDCAGALKRNIEKIETLRTYFAESMVIVVENDSTDGTKEILSDWKKHSKDVILIEGKKLSVLGTTHSNTSGYKQSNPSGGFYRIELLSGFRNQYMDYIQQNGKVFDFLIVIDIDIDDFLPSEIIKVIERAPEDWTGLFANGIKYYTLLGKRIRTRYYDDYAYLPHTETKESSVEMTFDALKLNSAVLSKKLKKAAFLPCRSAFGGIGVYQYRHIKDLRYKTGQNTKNAYFAALCEHIAVNLPLLAAGTNYVARDLLVFHTRLRSIKDILLEYMPAKLWLFLYKLTKQNV